MNKGLPRLISLVALLRRSVFSRLAGYEDTRGAERLAVDPAMRHIVGGRAKEKHAAATSRMGRFETTVLTPPIVTFNPVSANSSESQTGKLGQEPLGLW